jgi:hypothetical protein
LPKIKTLVDVVSINYQLMNTSFQSGDKGAVQSSTMTTTHYMSMRMTFFLVLMSCCSAIVRAGLMKGDTTINTYNNFAVRGSRRSLQMNQNGCPKIYSLKHCDDPSMNYAITCDWNTCLWNLDELDPNAPPASCMGISIVDPQIPDLVDVIRPCALWSLMYGEHQSVSPTLSGTLHSYVSCL